MITLQSKITSHYTLPSLLDTILAAVGGKGHVDQERLSQVEEFHLGGAPATDRLIPRLMLEPGSEVLDIGSGVGGPARHIARATGARVTGVDLTLAYVDIACQLSRQTGQSDAMKFVAGSALDLPFDAGRFDAATLMHVGMNIDDKPRLMTEAFRVLKPGGIFAIYDIMRTGDEELAYPLPWAAEPSFSFVATSADYRRAGEAAGFAVVAETPRRDEALAFLRATRERVEACRAEGLPPPPGVNLVMGADAPLKLGNLGAAVMSGALAPVEIILRKGG